jgi:hypothetical protein
LLLTDKIGLSDEHSELKGRRRSWSAKNISDVSVRRAIGLGLVFLTASVKFSGCFQKSAALKASGQARCGSAVGGVNRHHAGLHVILHVAVKHPGSGMVGEHVNGHHASG